MKQSTSTHGGARKGAGRKLSPEPRKRINVYLTTSEIEQLKKIHKSVSQAIRMLLKEKLQ